MNVNTVQQVNIACLHVHKRSGLFWRAGFYPANQINLKTYQNSDWLEKSRLS